jgi:type IV pilus assembly protein PilZ
MTGEQDRDPAQPGNRRSDDRSAIELKVEYKRLNAFFADFTKNISKGGTFIRTNKPLDIGTEFLFKLYVPRLDEPLQIRGEVRWIVTEDQVGDSHDAPGMGIRFIYEDDGERAAIEGVVEKLMVDSLGPLLYTKLMARGGGPTGE